VNNKLKPIFLLILSFVTGAKGQSLKGTVVVIGQSQSEIVIAADSRVTNKEIGSHRDNYCKIPLLDHYSAFAAAGNVSFYSFWNAYGQARAAFDQAEKSSSEGYLKEAATLFADAIVPNINRAIISDDRATNGVEEDRFFSASFIGFDNKGPAFYEVEIFLNPVTRTAYSTVTPERMYTEMHWGAMGRSETANEVLIGSTDFAKDQTAQWAKTSDTIPAKDREIYWAIHLVDITMIYNQRRTEVGGPVDGITITPKGYEWAKRKSTCQP
jgi:hypothetical protein